MGIMRNWIELQVWSVRIAWRYLNGRWHYFRDAPMHVVARMADWCGSEDGDMNAIGWVADAELKLRLRRTRNSEVSA
jgi:hypothetical protein